MDVSIENRFPEDFRCLIAMPDPAANKRMANALNDIGIANVYQADTMQGLLACVRSELPHVAIIHALLPGADDKTLAKSLSAMALYRYPAMIYAYPGGMPMPDGNHLSTSPDAKTLSDVLSSAWPLPVNAELFSRAEALISHMGINDCPARNYLSCAIALCVQDGERLQNLSKQLMTEVADAYCVTPRRAADAIRRAIDRLWMTGDIDKLYAFFGNTIDDRRGKPTMSAMIATAAQLIRLREDLKIP